MKRKFYFLNCYINKSISDFSIVVCAHNNNKTLNIKSHQPPHGSIERDSKLVADGSHDPDNSRSRRRTGRRNSECTFRFLASQYNGFLQGLQCTRAKVQARYLNVCHDNDFQRPYV